jgi:hypothetical protein
MDMTKEFERMLDLEEERQNSRIRNLDYTDRLRLAGTTQSRREQHVLAATPSYTVRLRLAANKKLHPVVQVFMAKDKHIEVQVLKVLSENPNVTASARKGLHRNLAKKLKSNIDTLARNNNFDKLAKLIRAIDTN